MSKKKSRNQAKSLLKKSCPGSPVAGAPSRTTQIIESSRAVRFDYLKNPSFWWMAGLILVLAAGAIGARLKYLEDKAPQEIARRPVNYGPSTGHTGPDLLSPGNPLVPSAPPSAPPLSKEYIYAGDKLLAVEDVNAAAAPPSDLAVWRPSSGAWWVMGGQYSQPATQSWGIATDTPMPADYDGDGKTDFGVFRPADGIWYVIKSSDGSQVYYYLGVSTDTPVTADFDGDGKSDAAVFRPSTGVWYIRQSSDNAIVQQQFGTSVDTPAPADFDGDGKADVSVWRSANSTFYILKSANAQLQYATYGQTGDKPICADYDGDGRADLAVWRNADWYILQSSNNRTAIYNWGNTSTDKAVQNDYDGDGKVDIAVWRASESVPGAGDVGNWYIRNSSTGQSRIEHWGTAGDIPVPALYRR